MSVYRERLFFLLPFMLGPLQESIVMWNRVSAMSKRAGRTCRHSRVARRAFTLIEALMATGLLLMVVVAVTSAITAGQQHAYEAHQQIAASLVAEELMGRVAAEEYDDLLTWNGHTEDVGEMTDMEGAAMPSALQMVGRDVRVTIGMQTISGLDVRVRGATISVRSFNASGRTLATISRFVPEPQS